MKIKAVTEKGGSVTFNEEQGVWASYAVAGVGGEPKLELFYAGIPVNEGRTVSLFVNRETGLVVVDVQGEKGGNEICRFNAKRVGVK